MLNEIRITAEADGARLDSFLADHTEYTRSRIASLVKSGSVTVNGVRQEKAGYALRRGDEILLAVPESIPTDAVPQDIPLTIVYEDDDVAVVYKPSGMVVHPAAGNPDGTMVNALLYKLDSLSGIGGEIRPGIVHRIDKDTSGLLLVAKNDNAHVSLSNQIAAHSVNRLYKTIVIGSMKTDGGCVDAPIGRHPTDRKKMAIVANGHEAQTRWRLLEPLRGASYLECELTTGRTHQIRVHMASLGHPVLGDPIYGPKKSPYPVEGGQLLHACRIGFTHPVTGKRLLFESEPEERFTYWLNKLRIKE